MMWQHAKEVGSVDEPSQARALVAQVAMIAAVVALPFAMLATWVSTEVVDSQRYVESITPLAADPAVKAATVAYLERETVALLHLSGSSGPCADPTDLTPICIGIRLGGQVMDTIRPFVAQFVHPAVVAAVDSPAFAQAWVAANRSAHQEILAILDGSSMNLADGADRITIPLADVLNVITAGLVSAGQLPPGLAPTIHPSLTLVRADDLKNARTGYRVLTDVRPWLPIAFVVFLLTALVAGRPRRRIVRQLGIGTVLAMVLLDAVMLLVKHDLTSGNADKVVFDAVWGVLTRTLSNATYGVGVGAAIAVVWTWPQRVAPVGQPVPSAVPTRYVQGAATVALLVTLLLMVSW